MAKEEVKPEPDGLTPAERHTRLVMQHELLLVEATRELAGKEMYLEMVRSNRRADPVDVYEASTAYRESEAKFERTKTELIRLHKQTIRLIAQEKSDAGEL